MELKIIIIIVIVDDCVHKSILSVLGVDTYPELSSEQ